MRGGRLHQEDACQRTGLNFFVVYDIIMNICEIVYLQCFRTRHAVSSLPFKFTLKLFSIFTSVNFTHAVPHYRL